MSLLSSSSWYLSLISISGSVALFVFDLLLVALVLIDLERELFIAVFLAGVLLDLFAMASLYLGLKNYIFKVQICADIIIFPLYNFSYVLCFPSGLLIFITRFLYFLEIL